MSKELITSLLDALAVSPDNIPLRLQVADMMVKENLFADAAAQYQEVLNRHYGNEKAQLGLARSYYHQQKYSTAIIIYEQLPQLPAADQVVFIKCLVKENSIAQAVTLYQQLLALNPAYA